MQALGIYQQGLMLLQETILRTESATEAFQH